jgi:nucleoside-diphosphate-sugar epimerase
MKNGISPDVREKRRLILIGADGFIGSSMDRYFRDSGWQVHSTVFSRSPERGEVRLDVTDPGAFDGLPAGVPVVNASGLPDQQSSAGLMRLVHVGGMRNLTAWARRTGCPHIVHLSSVAVYGNATVGTGRTEAATRRRKWNPLFASLPYGRTKARAEAVLEHSGVPWSAPRLPAVYGPGDSFFTGQLRRLILEKGRPLPPGGTRPVSIMPVGQMGPLIEHILRSGPLNAALNAAGAHVPWMEILKSYADEWGCALKFAPRHRIRDYLNFSDPGTQMAAFYARWGAEFPDQDLRSRLDWKPGVDWRETVRQAARASVPQGKSCP